jgi:hypothetical protein
MDCEKFEPLLLDELYEELDELTSAAVKRHVSGCARCASILNGMKGTRSAIADAGFPLVAVPDGLEDRILAAAREAQKVVPIRGRWQKAVSVAGSWAMRPQTAMAAVFLLMIGTSAFLIRSKNYASRDSTVSVTVQGAPSPTAATPQGESAGMDDKAAAQAHGPSAPPNNITRPPAVAASAVALNDEQNNGPVDRLTGGAAREKGKADDDKSGALGTLAANGEGRGAGVAAGGKDAPRPAPTTAPVTNAGVPGGAPNQAQGGQAYADNNANNGMYSQQPAPPPPTKQQFSKRSGPEGQGQDAFSLGAAAFRARNFAEATRQFDQAAAGGDTNAALWAAESVREGQGCAVALGRFDSLSQKASGSWVGHESSLRAARCQINMGQFEGARDRLTKLASVPSHQQQANQAMNELQVAQKNKAGGGAGSGGANAAPKRATAPAAARPAPAAPARAPSESEQKKAQDQTDHGF